MPLGHGVAQSVALRHGVAQLRALEPRCLLCTTCVLAQEGIDSIRSIPSRHTGRSFMSYMHAKKSQREGRDSLLSLRGRCKLFIRAAMKPGVALILILHLKTKCSA